MRSEVATKTAAAPQPPAGGRVALRRYLRGDLGMVPVFLTLVLIAIFFQVTSSGLFMSPRNLSNLVNQIAVIGTLGLASALVLLIGEIDLSLGAVAYTCGATTVALSVRSGWSAGPALLGGLAAGLAIGLVNGLFIAVLRVPSFIVTLAGLLAYQGVVIHILEPQTDIILTDPTIGNLVTTYLSPVLGIVLPLAAVALYALGLFWARLRRRQAGLREVSIWESGIRVVIAVVVVIVAVAIFEAYLGVPQSAIILIGLILLFWLILRFTAFGRHVYAVGGNAEASRRAGINVLGIRITIFMLASLLAAVGGILLASRTGVGSAEVDQTLLLEAIATAVIGGVSLFGGRGSVWAVVIGSLVIGSLSNGLALLNQKPDIVYIVEGVVLLVAVTSDALARRRAGPGGR